MKLILKVGLLILITCISPVIHAQICHGGKPVNEETLPSEVYTIKFPKISENEIYALKSQSTLCHKTLKFAKVLPTNINPDDEGYWTKTPGGKKIWRVRLVSPNALSLNVTFGKYKLNEGVSIFLYDPAKKYVIGALTSKNNNLDKLLAVSPVPGDELIIELQVDKNVESYGELELTSIGHDYIGIFDYIQKDGQFGRSGSCNVDINCIDSPSIQLIKRAVCRIIYNNNELCTGTLVNNTTQDGRPYLLTANHCIPNQATASTAVFLFGYESPVCNGPDGNSTWSISGSQLLATAKSIDFSLVNLSKEIPKYYFPYFAGWDHSDKDLTNTFSIHHPWGDVKKISFDNGTLVNDRYSSDYQPNSHWRVVKWDEGTTEPGSSGCPIFNNNFMLVGDLTGGDATCANPVNDYYTKFSMSWDFFDESDKQLKKWLDPIETELQSINGYFPYEEIFTTCEKNANYIENDKISLTKPETGWGFWSGHSSYQFSSFAEKFQNDTVLQIPGIYMQIARLPKNDTGTIYIKLWSGDEFPGLLLAKKRYSYTQLIAGEEIYLPFDTVVNVKGNYFAGYDISYQAESDTFAVYQVNSSIKSPSKSFYFKNNLGWQKYSRISQVPQYATLAVCPRVCGITNKKKPIIDDGDEPVIFPNPAFDLLSVDFKNTDVKHISLSIYDLSGRLVQKNSTIVYYRTMYVDLNKLQTGIYVCEIIVNNKKFSRKLVVADK